MLSNEFESSGTALESSEKQRDGMNSRILLSRVPYCFQLLSRVVLKLDVEIFLVYYSIPLAHCSAHCSSLPAAITITSLSITIKSLSKGWEGGPIVAQWLVSPTTKWKVAGSNPADESGETAEGE